MGYRVNEIGNRKLSLQDLYPHRCRTYTPDTPSRRGKETGLRLGTMGVLVAPRLRPCIRPSPDQVIGLAVPGSALAADHRHTLRQAKAAGIDNRCAPAGSCRSEPPAASLHGSVRRS